MSFGYGYVIVFHRLVADCYSVRDEKSLFPNNHNKTTKTEQNANIVSDYCEALSDWLVPFIYSYIIYISIYVIVTTKHFSSAPQIAEIPHAMRINFLGNWCFCE